ncbi:MAG: hypothetical protein J5691_01060 [Bacilli bacterium]|nr:hypothetical protein [Bacilli bacterium]
MAASYHTLNIYPYPLTNLSVVGSASGSLLIVNNSDHYTVSDVADTENVTISADGYNDITLTNVINDHNINIGNWYAWTGYVDTQGGSTVTWYTLSATPSTGDSVYQTPPYLDSVVTTSTTIYGDIDTYKFSFGADITAASASSITVGGNPK